MDDPDVYLIMPISLQLPWVSEVEYRSVLVILDLMGKSLYVYDCGGSPKLLELICDAVFDVVHSKIFAEMFKSYYERDDEVKDEEWELNAYTQDVQKKLGIKDEDLEDISTPYCVFYYDRIINSQEEFSDLVSEKYNYAFMEKVYLKEAEEFVGPVREKRENRKRKRKEQQKPRKRQKTD